MGKRLMCTNEPFHDECLSGYLIRTVEINNYEKLVWLFKPTILVNLDCI
jgi:hypothetical protein